MYKILMTCLLLSLLSTGLHAQEDERADSARIMQAQAKGLKIGDLVPDVAMDKIVQVDGRVTAARLSDYADRLLILDFMYTTCSSCIGGLPHKDQLQKEFGDRIKIMTVVGGELYSPGMIAREDEAFIRKYLTNPNSFLSRRGVQIPWVVENKTLNAYFPHMLASHVVWIYKGRVIGFTEQDYVDKQNIELILAGKDPKLPVKNDFMPPVDVRTPLMQQASVRFTGGRQQRYAAVFGAYQNGVEVRSGLVIDSVQGTRRDYIINLDVLNIYITRWWKVLDTLISLAPSHVLLEVKDPGRYVESGETKEYNLVRRNKTKICYEAFGPDTGQTEKAVALATIRDLDRLLGLHGRFEQRKMKCLVLVRTDNRDRLRSKGLPKAGDAELETPSVKLRNRPLNSIVWQLNERYGNPPVFDGTGYQDNVDMDLNLDSWKDIASLRRQLQNYGLDLKEEERELQVFVLTETSNK